MGVERFVETADNENRCFRFSDIVIRSCKIDMNMYGRLGMNSTYSDAGVGIGMLVGGIPLIAL